MKNLLEIAKIVTKKRVNKIEIFDDNALKNKKSKFNIFYEALVNNQLKNDRDAATLLYKSTPTDAKYRQLKSRFKKRLLNTLFFLDVNTPSAPNYERAYFSCNKDWVLINILANNGAHHTVQSMARQTLTTSLKFKFADIIIGCARLLRNYAAKNNDEKEFNSYNAIIQQYTEILNAEVKSEELFQQVFMYYQQSQEEINQHMDLIEANANQLVNLSDIYDSPIIFYNVYMVWILRFELSKEFESMLEVCEQAEQHLTGSGGFTQPQRQVQFFIKRMSAYLHLRNYRQGKESAERCLRLIRDRNTHWFIFMEYYMLLVFHTENYIQASAIVKKAKSETNFKKLDLMEREKWNIFEAYLNYIIEVPFKNNPVLATQKSKSFKVSQFINQVANYPRQYRNYNILILVLQTLFLIDKRSYALANERIDQLRSLTNKRLKSEQFFRARQFVKLLIQLSKADFQIEEMRAHEKYYARLLETPFFYRGQNAELEVIPYETLWNILTRQLQDT
ncbi:MAG: hypothetical protein AAF798_04165 [Bacteroidota bacterium]